MQLRSKCSRSKFSNGCCAFHRSLAYGLKTDPTKLRFSKCTKWSILRKWWVGGGDSVFWNCTHGGCYATDGATQLMGRRGDNVLWTCTHTSERGNGDGKLVIQAMPLWRLLGKNGPRWPMYKTSRSQRTKPQRNAKKGVFGASFQGPCSDKFQCKTQHFNKTLGCKMSVSWGRFPIWQVVLRYGLYGYGHVWTSSKNIVAICPMNHEMFTFPWMSLHFLILQLWWV